MWQQIFRRISLLEGKELQPIPFRDVYFIFLRSWWRTASFLQMNTKLDRRETDLINELSLEISLIWLVPSSTNLDPSQIHEQLKQYRTQKIVTMSVDSCLAEINRRVDEIIFLIVSEDFAHDVIPKVSEAHQLKFILIWFKDDNTSCSLSSCDKVLGCFNNSDALSDTIEHGMMNFSIRLSDRFIFDDLPQQDTRDLSAESTDFVW